VTQDCEIDLGKTRCTTVLGGYLGRDFIAFPLANEMIGAAGQSRVGETATRMGAVEIRFICLVHHTQGRRKWRVDQAAMVRCGQDRFGQLKEG
jgi:hypothetical protein